MSVILTLALALAGAACEGADLGACPADSADMQSQGHTLVNARCVTCHNSALSGSARMEAPEELNFDDLTIVREWASEMYGEAKEGAMPPTGKLADSDVELLRVWLACGAQ